MVYTAIALFGLIVGSFLNVCVYRLPRGESIVKPRSHCPECGRALPWNENIPVISYIFLRGKCSGCGKHISFIYPVVEILTAAIAVVLYVFFGLSPRAAIYFVLFSALIIATFTDFERQEIPDVITLPGIAAGLLAVSIFPELLTGTRLEAVINSILGILVGGGSLYILGFVGEIIFRKESMGGGYIKLLAMIGAFLGWKLTLLTFFLAPFFGSFTGLILKIREGKEVIPYGPYLSLAALISVLFGERIIGFLFHL